MTGYAVCINVLLYRPLVVNTSRSFPHAWLITGFVTRLTRRLPLVEQELLTLPEQLISPPVFSGVRVIRSLVLYVCFVDRCLSFCTYYLYYICSSSIYGFWLPLWYLQTLLGFRVAQSLVFRVVFYRYCLSFYPVYFAFVLSVLRFTSSDYYPFEIFILFVSIVLTISTISGWAIHNIHISNDNGTFPFYPLANEVAKGYSKATVLPSVTSLWTL